MSEAEWDALSSAGCGEVGTVLGKKWRKNVA